MEGRRRNFRRPLNIAIVPHSERSNENVINTKNLELKNWKFFHVYKVVPDEGQPRITTIWAITEKVINGKSAIEAKLVVSGFKEEHIFIVESPTAHNRTLRKTFTIAEMKS